MLLCKVATEIFKITYVVHITFLLGSTALNYWLNDLLVDWCSNTQHIIRKGEEWTVLAEACLIEAVMLELDIFFLFKVFCFSSFMELEISKYLQKNCVLKTWYCTTLLIYFFTFIYIYLFTLLIYLFTLLIYFVIYWIFQPNQEDKL